jgi:hypothetical protein
MRITSVDAEPAKGTDIEDCALTVRHGSLQNLTGMETLPVEITEQTVITLSRGDNVQFSLSKKPGQDIRKILRDLIRQYLINGTEENTNRCTVEGDLEFEQSDAPFAIKATKIIFWIL